MSTSAPKTGRTAAVFGLFATSLLWFTQPNANSLDEEYLFAEMPAVVTATRMPQSVDKAPLAITVLDRELIEASGAVEIPDLFRLVPGFQVGLSWRDHHTAVTYHGQSDGLDRRLQVLIDGKVALTTLFGLVDWDRLGITIDDIERIEVMRGPAGVYYGSNAFSGAINIITRDALTESGLRVSTTFGSRDIQIVSTSYSEAWEKFDFRINASYFNTDGFSGVDDGSTAQAARLKGRYQISPNDLLEFQLGAASGPWGRGGTDAVTDPATDKDAEERYGSIRFTRTHSPGNESYLQIESSVSEEDDEFNVGPLSELLGVPPLVVPGVLAGQPDQVLRLTPFDYIAKRQDIEFQQMLSLSGIHRLVWGLGYRQDEVDSPGTIGLQGDRDIETYRAYSNLEYSLSEKVVLNAGLMFEDTDINKSELSARLGANFQLADNHVLRLAVAENYRHPFLAEAFHDVAVRFADGTVLEQVNLAPEVLTPERIRSYELGYIGHWRDDRIRVEIKLFREEMDNEAEYVLDPTIEELVAMPQLQAFRFNVGAVTEVSGGATDINGIEGNINWQMTTQTRLWLSYSFAETDQHCQLNAIRCFHETDATPRHTASALLIHNFGSDWQASLAWHYLDEMSWILYGPDNDSYSRFDARLAKTLRLDSADLTLELIGQNLGGDYHEFSDRNLFQTRAFMRATLQFH